MDELRLISDLSSEDESVARAAWSKLFKRTERIISSAIFSLVPKSHDRDEITSEVLLRIWKVRKNLSFETVDKWQAFVRTVARHIALDRLRKRRNETELNDSMVDESAGDSLVDELREYRSRLYSKAHELWLGVDPNLDDDARFRRVFAAQLFYLNKLNWRKVAELCGLNHLTERGVLDAWLEEPWNLKVMTFHAFFVSSDALCGYILNPTKPLTAKELDELSAWLSGKQASGPETIWQPDEVRVILLRFRNGCEVKDIKRIYKDLDQAMIEDTIGRTRKLLPFDSMDTYMRRSLGGKAKLIFPLERNFWKRLTFQYHYLSHFELPHTHLVERMEILAFKSQLSCNLRLLHQWISMKRLPTELDNYLQGVSAK